MLGNFLKKESGILEFELIFDLGTHNPIYEQFTIGDINTTLLESELIFFTVIGNEEVRIGEGTTEFPELNYNPITAKLRIKI